MGKKYSEISDRHMIFIERQKLFFIGTATADSRINISPKGLDSFRIINANRVLWLNLTGSGNESAAHLQSNSRMTIMFCAFEGSPLILRLYGHARMVLPDDKDWDELSTHFPAQTGARQIFDISVDLVHSSCGFGVPLFDFVDDRDTLELWAKRKGDDGIKAYWQEKNSISLDGEPIPISTKQPDD